MEMEGKHEPEEAKSHLLPAHAALIPAANRLTGAHKGWYFAVMVRAAYSRLEGVV